MHPPAGDIADFRLLPATADHFARMIAGEELDGVALASTPVADAGVLGMLAGLAETIAAQFAPAAWIVVADGEAVGLLSVTALVGDGAVQIGYGVAPGSQGCGYAGAAVAALLDLFRDDERVTAVVAETRTDNIASQRVLERNGFAMTGERFDEEDGDLLSWRFQF
ncbi:GNAT family N-acetyltransferase [Novosphingobium sp. CECT 9465]|uniref:GNAT family N-acetyltransferase n=1 Tax=Novosphingobium sp. CECT 9465 TaxID=2829794 RepID=UPI001E407297|nr:GNAT family N-acetyltransferase [Novosphingobium sp. CECT 9465]CAH0495748.1 hypothetical protein NVSP9465_00757 [Novosphingobium sp. CECT 9465]